MIVLISGGFDPVHVGHIDYIREAWYLTKGEGKLILALNSDRWLMKKKGFVFMTWSERAKVLESNRYLPEVIPVEDDDGTVCDAIEKVKPDIFANGGDRGHPNGLEDILCNRLGIQQIFGVGGAKTQSSSGLVKRLFQ